MCTAGMRARPQQQPADGRGEAGVAGGAGAAHLHDDDDQEEEEEGPESQLARSSLELEPHRIRE